MYVITSTLSANSLDIKVEIVTTDTQEIMSVKALIDSRATGLFIDGVMSTSGYPRSDPIRLIVVS